jgi:hypothetical protein
MAGWIWVSHEWSPTTQARHPMGFRHDGPKADASRGVARSWPSYSAWVLQRGPIVAPHKGVDAASSAHEDRSCAAPYMLL